MEEVPSEGCVKYNIGDCVYFDLSVADPYQIRRIEGFKENGSGNILVKAVRFLRRRDLPESYRAIAEKKTHALNTVAKNVDYNELSVNQRQTLKQRELFLCRQVETLPPSFIKGRCQVNFLSESESLLGYLNSEDTFFYCVVFDLKERAFLVDSREIRVGSKFQTLIPPMESEEDSQEKETLLWTPNNDLTDKEIDDFLVKVKTVGVIRRALNDPNASLSDEQCLINLAASASRDATTIYGMNLLHENNYSLTLAYKSLNRRNEIVDFSDEMEEWTSQEAKLFLLGIGRYGKDFRKIRDYFLPWKSFKNIIEYYYMWKTTDSYGKLKNNKISSEEPKFKCIRLPTENLNNGNVSPVRICTVCKGISMLNTPSLWDPSSRKHLYFCEKCWNSWKKYSSL